MERSFKHFILNQEDYIDIPNKTLDDRINSLPTLGKLQGIRVMLLIVAEALGMDVAELAERIDVEKVIDAANLPRKAITNDTIDLSTLQSKC
jgi:hypothetical protein